MAKRRAAEEFSLSFLDVICCGFRAVILLLMITKTVEPQIIEASTVELEGKLADLQEQIYEIRGETVFWKLDLYEADSDFRYGAEASDNPATTMRVLTIMLARDW